MTNIYKVISTRRTLRRFKSTKNISIGYLEKMARLGALAPSRVNRQLWEFIIVKDPIVRKKVFANILWGSKNPLNKAFADPKYAPNAYIAIIINEKIGNTGYEYELGACAENIMIYAWSLGIGGVWIHSINKLEISKIIQLPKGKILDSVIGLGYPAHTSKVVKFKETQNYSYDRNLNLLVPKREARYLIHYDKHGLHQGIKKT